MGLKPKHKPAAASQILSTVVASDSWFAFASDIKEQIVLRYLSLPLQTNTPGKYVKQKKLRLLSNAQLRWLQVFVLFGKSFGKHCEFAKLWWLFVCRTQTLWGQWGSRGDAAPARMTQTSNHGQASLASPHLSQRAP